MEFMGVMKMVYLNRGIDYTGIHLSGLENGTVILKHTFQLLVNDISIKIY